jgi:hypothetical protein
MKIAAPAYRKDGVFFFMYVGLCAGITIHFSNR